MPKGGDEVDNFLLECILALELNSHLSKCYDTDTLFACKLVLPIFVDDSKYSLSDDVATATVSKAQQILRSLSVLNENEDILRSFCMA